MSSLDILADQYLNFLVFEKGLSEKTIESYSSDLTRYLEFLRQKGVKKIVDADTPLILKHLIALRDAGLGVKIMCKTSRYPKRVLQVSCPG